MASHPSRAGHVGRPTTHSWCSTGVNKWFGDLHVLKDIDLAVTRERWWW